MTEIQIYVDTKHYTGSQKTVLEGIDFTLRKDEIVAIVGPSGAGKSTLLNIIGGLDSQFEGALRFDSNEQEESIGYMFQSPRLMPWLTVAENIQLVARESENVDVDALITSVGLEGRGHLFPLQLSGGMQRRVALARAFVNHPSILLLDEPFVSLDKPTADRLRGELLTLWDNERPAVLYITHDLREALCMADRILFLSTEPGKIIFEQEVTLPRPRMMEDAGVSDLHNDLIRRFPGLLAGIV